MAVFSDDPEPFRCGFFQDPGYPPDEVAVVILDILREVRVLPVQQVGAHLVGTVPILFVSPTVDEPLRVPTVVLHPCEGLHLLLFE